MDLFRTHNNQDLFRKRIRISIADESLQKALDANAERRARGRANAIASLPDWAERRQKAHAIRADVIEHLDEYLSQFISRVQSNGITVHRADNAAEAVRIVLEIAETRTPHLAESGSVRSDAKGLLFAKSKSMLSEEINLNPALQAAGHRVVETDLGEYIVQLRGERPSHIISPAVHLRRHQVAQLFHEKLGIPYSEDIPTLTTAARGVLRQVFLNADIGITGVNFGIAETGTITLITNEGNGRMCATLPPVHIALMGMERLLPTLDDLALFLSMLPRSSSGQKLSVYTQLLQRPEPDQQKHLVIVDNGRSKLRASALKESLYCIRCGACLNACPIFREISGHAYLGKDGAIAPYPGPIGSVISPGLMGANYVQLAQASSLCGACKDACPVDIDLPKMLLRLRAGELPAAAQPAAQHTSRSGAGLPPTLKLILAAYSRIAAHPSLFSLAQKLAGWFSILLPAFIPLPAFSGWGFSKDLPKPAATPFRKSFTSQPQGWRVDGQMPVKLGAANQPAPAPLPPVPDDLVQIFTRELNELGGHVYPISVSEYPEKLANFLHERGIGCVQMGASVAGLAAAALVERGIQVQHRYDADLQAGITPALAGIAATGTLVIVGSVAHPLTASLVPPIHIAVLMASAILPSLEQAMLLPDLALAPAVVLVSGPSRTADIEMTLTIGVHGPGELHVFVVDDTAGK